MSPKSRRDYLKAIYFRYRKVSKPLRGRILDEFCQVCGCDRKYAIRLLNGSAPQVGRVMRETKENPRVNVPGYSASAILLDLTISPPH